MGLGACVALQGPYVEYEPLRKRKYSSTATKQGELSKALFATVLKAFTGCGSRTLGGGRVGVVLLGLLLRLMVHMVTIKRCFDGMVIKMTKTRLPLKPIPCCV